jgi:hypothetical protein
VVLTDKQKQELRIAIKDAFSQGELEMLFNENTEKFNQKNFFNLVSAGDNYEQQVFALVGWLDRQEKISDLLAVAKSYNPGNVKLRNFRVYYLSLLSEEQLIELEEILNSIEFTLIRKAYDETLPKGSKIDNPNLQSLKSVKEIIISLLEDYCLNDSIASILKFINYLKKTVKGQDNQQLDAWYQKLPANIKDIGEEQISPPRCDKLQSCLLVAVFPEGDKLRLEVGLIEDEKAGSNPIPWDVEDFKKEGKYQVETTKGFYCNALDEVPAKLQEIIEGVLDRYLFQDLSIVIEISLPHQYLANKLHHEWCLTSNDEFEGQETREAIVKNYDFVVHPLKRITGRQSRIKFQRGWKRLENWLCNPSVISQSIRHIYCLNCNLSWTDLEKKMIAEINNLTGQEPSACQECLPIGLKLNASELESTRDEVEFLRTILSGGFPLAFWKRYQAPSQLSDFEALEEKLAPGLQVKSLNDNLKPLIKRLCEICRNPHLIDNPSPEDLGYHLGFVCDSLPRMRQIQQLQEPRQKR